jgi:hypothetical protein
MTRPTVDIAVRKKRKIDHKERKPIVAVKDRNGKEFAGNIEDVKPGIRPITVGPNGPP